MSKQRQYFLLETIAVVIQAENIVPCRSGSLSCQGGSVNSRPPKIITETSGSNTLVQVIL